MLNVLKDIKIRKIYQQDPINKSNFSLDTPLIEIELFHENESVNKLLFGLVNPIDNSTYVMKSGMEAIYHIDGLKDTLETFDFVNFIDSRIIAFDPDSIHSLSIHSVKNRRSRNKKKHQKKLKLSIKRNKNQWYGPKGTKKQILNTQKVLDYLTSLSSLKSSFILDEVSDKAKKQIERYLDSPLYILEVSDKNENAVTYKISPIITSLPGVKMEKRPKLHYQGLPSQIPFSFR